ncbi:MAG: type III-A CRISPR-associated RAMP protein Csm3 [Bacteroidetes bacterium]|nr:type III-A CRISPR-associated RAMP protein Csm3 [Bacteroidota bacterium]
MKKKKFNINIKVKTGLHIGVGSDKPEIGGIDNQFIKDPVTNLPYIPGSSLKGKIRCLLETENNSFNEKAVQSAFAGDDHSPTKLIFRDAFLSNSFMQLFEMGDIATEVKTEIAIDRKTGKAKGGALRTIERIPPDTEFSGEILIRYDSDDDLKLTESILKEGINLLNNDYLGGSGSRGYGAVVVILS